MSESWAAELRGKGLLDAATAARLEELELRAHVPLSAELQGLLYLGALLILAGVGAAVKDRLVDVGPITILSALGAAAAACFAYCFRRGRPFSPERVESPTAAFDYVLYLGCGLAGLFVSYLELKFRLLGPWWDLYLWTAGSACVWLAYRFDNRLVLATGLVDLGTAIGARFTRWGLGWPTARATAFALGAALMLASQAGRRRGVKAHFEDVYLRFGVNLALLALFADSGGLSSLSLWLLLLACAAVAAWSAREKRFETFAYAAAYAYFGFLRGVVPVVGGLEASLALIALSSAAMIAALVWARSRFSEAA
jgi:hypothetical protein